MESKKSCSVFRFYRGDKNQKGKLYFISFKFLCLSIYMIGFYYIFLNNSLENGSSEIVKNCNIYKRNLVQVEKNKDSKKKRNLKHKKVDMNKTKSNENNNKCNEENVEKNEHSISNDFENSNIEIKSNISICHINYNDMSKNLTETELHEVLNSLEKCPPNEDLRNIWINTFGFVKEDNGVNYDDGNLLYDSIWHQNIYSRFETVANNGVNYDDGNLLYDSIWHQNIYSRFETVASEKVEYNDIFF
ncbi:hypothetical protein PFFVO_03104 [Plasmodium falciparum Vietnam Oak-Knoll (FVO)]|uniref:Plasmodium RESA N-terminal domain-containing protein n=1 Tax=Plasmodium falciparum Vietnam Oak-Knoll (FVO) TaxID=1036723 RepID=A0A024V706_PLAFA|nr:hypothetical protein PFFVO_03104 [Plasmodium falciparum Vietnam Oak-Knoll (FVO)]